jgi:hypothetical protein
MTTKRIISSKGWDIVKDLLDKIPAGGGSISTDISPFWLL